MFTNLATRFNNGYAIIGGKCAKVPWDTHKDEGETCSHYSIVCEEHGYIDLTGKMVEFGQFTFEDISKKADWKTE